jgi:hypothetical protein
MPAQSYPPKSTTATPGVFVDGGSATALPMMDSYGPETRWVDIYSKGNTTSTFKVTSDVWITATPSSGTLTPPGATSDQRVLISIDWKSAPAGESTSKINIDAGGTAFTISLPLRNTNVTAGFAGFVESDKTISIEPEHWTSATSSSDAHYDIIPGYGRTLSGATLFPVTISTQSPPSSPKLTYNIFLFTTTTASITVHLATSMNTDHSRPLAYAISIDDAKPTTAQYVPIVDLGTMPSNWQTAVQDAGYSYTTKHAVTAGAHVLNLWAVEPGVVFQKIVVDLGGVRTSYLGPPESMRIGFR